MATFRHESTYPQDRATVWAWHERPGAFTRLSPPGQVRASGEPSDGIHPGSEHRFTIGVPGTAGRVGPTWHARHTAYQPPSLFEDVMVSGPLRAWVHRHRFTDTADGGTRIEDQVDYELPFGLPDALARLVEPQLRGMFAYRERQLRDDLAFHAVHPDAKTIAVSGASGLVGTQLVAFLRGGGHDVRVLTRRPVRGAGEIQWDPEATDGSGIDPEALREVDVVIHLAGEPIGKRFTAQHKARVFDSRVRSTGVLARALAALAGDGRERAFVVASASGFYGADRGDEVLTEDAAPGDDFLALVCREWEAAADPARAAGVRVVHVRTGLVQSAGGGQLALQLPIFQAGLGGRLGAGRQWLPWITVDDLVGLYGHVALTPGLSGPVNAAAPSPVRAGEYAATLGRVLGRPTLLPVPAFGPRLLLGAEGARELALAGQRMDAGRAQEWGYRFRHTDLAAGLRHVLAR
jgi:uncharacterized protein (TIGR01777 family)